MMTIDNVRRFIFKDHPIIKQQGLLPGEVKALIEWVYFIERRDVATIDDIQLVLQGNCLDYVVLNNILLLLNDMLWEILQFDDTRPIHSSYIMEIQATENSIVLNRRLLSWGEMVDKSWISQFTDY